jgi:hypothetical protein
VNLSLLSTESVKPVQVNVRAALGRLKQLQYQLEADAVEPWIGVDLDGTLAHYDGWHGADKIGKPIVKMIDIVKQHLADGDKVKIFTARVADDPDGIARKAIEKWCQKYLGQTLAITNEKDNGMVKLYDDRAVAVENNSGKLLSDPDIKAASALVDKIKALPDAPTPTGMWSVLKRSKERRFGKSAWKKTPLKIISKPKDALAFKLLPVAQRDKLVDDAPVHHFDPHDLVTNQPVVQQADLIHFAHHGTDPEPAIVLKSKDGLYVHNGNHRSVLALLSGKKVKAKYIDLSQVSDLKASADVVWDIPLESVAKRLQGVYTGLPEVIRRNVHRVQVDPSLGRRTGKFDNGTVSLSPSIIDSNKTYGKTVKTPILIHVFVHECTHGLYNSLPKETVQAWRKLSGWKLGEPAGNMAPYDETRPDWPQGKSKETPSKDAQFANAYARHGADDDFTDSTAYILTGNAAQVPSEKVAFITALLKGLDVAAFDEGEHPRDAHGKFTGEGLLDQYPPTEVHGELKGTSADPRGRVGTFDPDKGGLLFHGTGVSYFKTAPGEIYTALDFDETHAFARGEIPGTGKGDEPKTMALVAKPGKTLDVGEAIDNALMEGEDDFEKRIFAEARALHARYVTFDHPTTLSGAKDVFKVVVSLYPNKDLKATGAFLVKASASLGQQAALRASKIADQDLVDLVSAFDEEEHPRDEHGKFVGGGGLLEQTPPTEAHGLLKGTNADPRGRVGTFDPDKGGLIFHGSGAAKLKFTSGAIYTALDYNETHAFARGEIPGTGSGGDHPRTFALDAKPGKTLDVNDAVDEALMNGEPDFEQRIFTEARSMGARYVTFDHPSGTHEDDKDTFKVIVSLYPNKDLKPTAAWNLTASGIYDEPIKQNVCSCGHGISHHSHGPDFGCDVGSCKCDGYDDELESAVDEDAAADFMSPGAIERSSVREKALSVTSKAYKLAGYTSFQGLPISIETAKGQVRKGMNADGTEWSVVMPCDYGYIKGTKGMDGQEVDCFLGPVKAAKFAYIVHQSKFDGNGFDEDKVLLGFSSADRAKKMYLSAYEKGVDLFQSMSVLPMHEFIQKVLATKDRKRPAKIHAEVL